MKLNKHSTSITTFAFKAHYDAGDVIKVGKASFFDGMCKHERTLYYDKQDKKNYVMLNGNAYVFKAYSVCPEPGLTIGRIN